jgi:hypothetical protein
VEDVDRSSVGQLWKTSIGVQLANCGRINRGSIGELKIKRSVGVSTELKIESVKER